MHPTATKTIPFIHPPRGPIFVRTRARIWPLAGLKIYGDRVSFFFGSSDLYFWPVPSVRNNSPPWAAVAGGEGRQVTKSYENKNMPGGPGLGWPRRALGVRWGPRWGHWGRTDPPGRYRKTFRKSSGSSNTIGAIVAIAIAVIGVGARVLFLNSLSLTSIMPRTRWPPSQLRPALARSNALGRLGKTLC